MQPKTPLPLGIVHGRFQPPHNGHLRYILAALTRAQRVIIGVATPKLCSEEEAARTGYPCTATLNPFSYDERIGMLSAALGAAGIPAERYSFIAFPSDYANLQTIVPPSTVFLMSITSEGDTRKAVHLTSLGYATEAVISLPEDEDREHAEAVRASARSGTDGWKALVPPAVAAYMDAHGLTERLR